MKSKEVGACRRSRAKRVKPPSVVADAGTRGIARVAGVLILVLLWTVTLSFYVLDNYILPRCVRINGTLSHTFLIRPLNLSSLLYFSPL